jgi:hypothetical protein
VCSPSVQPAGYEEQHIPFRVLLVVRSPLFSWLHRPLRDTGPRKRTGLSLAVDVNPSPASTSIGALGE